MRLLQYIKEEYVMSVNPTLGKKDEQVSIFRNPSMKELKEALDNNSASCRFYIDLKNKDFYVWDYRLLHEYASENLTHQGIKNNYPYNQMNGMWGEASTHGGNKLILDYLYSNNILAKLKKTPANIEIFLDNLKFVDRYFDTTNNISNNIRKDMDIPITEEYDTMLQVAFTKKSYEVFKNPTSKEIFTASDNPLQSARFVIDINNKDIYMFDYHLLHSVVAKHYNLPYPTDADYIYGQGTSLLGNKFRDVEFFDYVVGKKIKEKIKTIGWANKYFVDLSGYVSKLYKITLD